MKSTYQVLDENNEPLAVIETDKVTVTDGGAVMFFDVDSNQKNVLTRAFGVGMWADLRKVK